jgi:hypothetical protein
VTPVKPTTAMSAAQKVMMRDFNERFFGLMERFWNPENSEMYWDQLTEEAMNLLAQFQSRDPALNGFLFNIVSAFLNSREEMAV